MSPRSQLEKYRNLSSREMRMSVIRGGILGSTQPSTSVHSCLMATLVSHLLASPCSKAPMLLNALLASRNTGRTTQRDMRPLCPEGRQSSWQVYQRKMHRCTPLAALISRSASRGDRVLLPIPFRDQTDFFLFQRCLQALTSLSDAVVI